MSASLILRSPAIVSDPNRPKFVRDPLIRPGTKFLYDFTDARCHPGGVITPGAIPTGAIFSDLVSGIDAVADASWGSVLAGGPLNVATESSARIVIGAAGDFDLSVDEPEFVLSIWMKVPASLYTTTSFRQLFWLGSDDTPNNALCRIDTDSTGGLFPRGIVGTGSSAKGVSIATGLTPGAVTHLALRFVPGTRLSIYKDGVLSTTTTTAVPSDLANGAAALAVLSARMKSTIYRVSLTDIEASIATETAQGLSSSQILTAEQWIARDYAFCTNALSAAPKTAFS